MLSDEERLHLQSFARSRSLPSGLSHGARIILSSADGEANNSIAERLKLTKATVGKWRARFIERRIAALYDDVRPRTCSTARCGRRASRAIGTRSSVLPFAHV